jgi:hypothetical protein
MDTGAVPVGNNGIVVLRDDVCQRGIVALAPGTWYLDVDKYDLPVTADELDERAKMRFGYGAVRADSMTTTGPSSPESMSPCTLPLTAENCLDTFASI